VAEGVLLAGSGYLAGLTGSDRIYGRLSVAGLAYAVVSMDGVDVGDGTVLFFDIDAASQSG